MFKSKKQKESSNNTKPLEELPFYKISPTFHGRYSLLSRRALPFGGFYMAEVATYDTYEEAVADVKHLGWEA